MTDVKKQKTKKILNTVVNIVIWIFVAFSVLMTVLAFAAQGSEDGVPELFGKSLLTIQSPSMTGTYNVGDMVLMTKADAEMREALVEGNIVTYKLPVDVGQLKAGSLNTHRIDHFTEDGKIKTKGDYNTGVDSYEISRNDVIGISTESDRVPGVGAVVSFLCSSLGFFLCVVLPLILFFIYELYNFISLLVAERAKKAPISKETEEEIKRRAIEEYLKAQKESEAAEAADPQSDENTEADIEDTAAEAKEENNVGEENATDAE